MGTFLIRAKYSSAAWARMLKVADDRTRAVSALMDSIGGTLERLYWDVGDAAAFAIARLPDSVSAAAVITAVTRSGSFTGVEAHELLTQEQMTEALTLARDVGSHYRVPGSAAIDSETVT
jgi:uncharacterized protein with GYD domain